MELTLNSQTPTKTLLEYHKRCLAELLDRSYLSIVRASFESDPYPAPVLLPLITQCSVSCDGFSNCFYVTVVFGNFQLMHEGPLPSNTGSTHNVIWTGATHKNYMLTKNPQETHSGNIYLDPQLVKDMKQNLRQDISQYELALILNKLVQVAKVYKGQPIRRILYSFDDQ